MPTFIAELKVLAQEWRLYTLRSLQRLARAKHGSLLMESAVTIAVFGILGAAVLGAVSTSSINKGKFDAQSTVENIVRNQLESVFEEPYRTPDDPSYTTITPPNDYSVTVDTLPYEGNSEYNIQVVQITVFHRGDQVELFETLRTNR